MDDQHAKSNFNDEPDAAAEMALDAQAEADYESGRVVPHAHVIAWLDTWGTADELPCPISKST